MPESWPMNPAQRCSRLASSASGKLCATLKRAGGAAAARRSSRWPSASPPTRSKLNSVALIRCCNNLAQFASGQFLRSLPLPGCSASWLRLEREGSRDNRGTGSASKIARRSKGLR